MTDTPLTLEENIKAFDGLSEQLNRYHADKFVLIYNGEFISSYDTFDTAARQTKKRFGRGPFLIRQVGAPVKMRMPSSIAYRFINAHH